MLGDPKPRRFDFDVPAGGYAWWYLDVVDEDRGLGLTAIFFVGSVFSPAYFAARQRAIAAGSPLPNPEQFCAVNIALYQVGGGRRWGRGPTNTQAWALSEHPNFDREADQFRVGSSSIAWAHDDAGPVLTAELCEREPFLGRRPLLQNAIVGRVRLRPTAIFAPRIELDRWRDQPRHRWYPVAPNAHAEVEFSEPDVRFSGPAYHDVNEGDEGLESGFAAWNWSRASDGRRTTITYDVVDPDGHPHARGWRFDGDAAPDDADRVTAIDDVGETRPLPTARWGMHRAIRCDPGSAPTLVDTLEDAPFYTRNLVRTTLDGSELVAVHESIDLRRFSSRRTQFLLPFKIARRRG